MSNTDLGTSLASFIQANVRSRERSFFTSSGRSSARRRISHSTSLNFSQNVMSDSTQTVISGGSHVVIVALVVSVSSR
jgi:hypothetical protein